MGKYANHQEFGVNAPINYREDTTGESYLNGMSVIAPPGMKPKQSKARKYDEKTDFKAFFVEDIWDITPRALKGEKGVFTHNSVRRDKVDIYPHPKMIEMLKSL